MKKKLTVEKFCPGGSKKGRLADNTSEKSQACGSEAAGHQPVSTASGVRDVPLPPARAVILL